VGAVRDLREGADPAAPYVFIINLSLGDRKRPYFGRTSAWANLEGWGSTRLQLHAPQLVAAAGVRQ
jgi:hypothetical protein